MRLATWTSSHISWTTLLPAILLLAPVVGALPKDKPETTQGLAARVASASLEGSRTVSVATPTPTQESKPEKKPEGRKGDNKYFHEPGDDDYSGHYDSRYFKGLVSDEERTRTLSHMMRAYLVWFREKGLETWIAHGTLLGWWWNGKVGGVSPVSRWSLKD